MDQVVVTMGRAGAVLPIVCRPAMVDPVVELPAGVEVVGVPTGAEHDVSAVPYGRARAAVFMGKRIVEDVMGERYAWVSELPISAVSGLPEVLDGATFLERWSATDDALTAVDPGASYPVRSATTFGVEEHERSGAMLDALEHRSLDAVASIMAASHAGYDAMGLGHDAATDVVARVLDRPGVYGARSSGGGSGGTIVVMCRRGALDDVEALVR
jgi:L-arabinokinase